MNPLSAGIAAGTSIIGGLLNSKSQKRQEKLQREFAQNAIQWKAADAEKAGISKLYALGANTTSYSPVSTGGGLGDSISSAGQDIGRAIESRNTNTGRTGSMAAAATKLQLEGMSLDNDIKRADLVSKIATRNQPGNPPGINSDTTTPFIPGQGNATIELTKKLAPSGDQHNAEFGVTPDIAWTRTKHGWAPTIPQQLAESYESDWLGQWQWMARNQLAPIFDQDGYGTPPPYKLNPGQYYQYHFGSGDYRPDWGWKREKEYRR